ncbi:MAG: calcium-binding protein [Pseudomonadota bacterium]
MSFATEQNLLTNGTFQDGGTGWTANDVDPDIDSIVFQSGGVNFNAGNDPIIGDSITQTFNTTPGQELVMLLQARIFQGNSTHDFLIEVFDDADNLLASTDGTVERNILDHLSFSFTAASATTTIVITNTGTSNSNSSDGRIDQVGIFDAAEFDPVEINPVEGLSNRFQGTDRDDVINGSGRQDTIFASEGADTIDGASGNDLVDYSASDEGINIKVGRTEFGEAGTGGLAEGDVLRSIERVIGTEFDDVIDVNGSKLTLSGLGGNDRIVGSSNFDKLDGGDGDDTLVGGLQNDTLTGGAGNDSLDGGFGDADVAVFNGNPDGFLFQTDGDALLVLDQVTGDVDTLTKIEFLQFDDVTVARGDIVDSNLDVVGGAEAELLEGTNLGEFINARGGDDTVFGFGGDDDIRTGLGSDSIVAGAGDDTIDGGNNRDIVDAGAGNDVVIGGKGKDRISGADGDDALLGGSNRDRLEGGKGDDTLEGEDGRDFLSGGRGEDRMIGGTGRDTLTGGRDADTFLFSEDFGEDIITDFDADGGDVILLSLGLGIDDAADLFENHLSQSGADVLLDDLNGNTILLEGVALDDLGADQFSFFDPLA